MNSKLNFILFLSLLALFSCKKLTTTPIKYNDTIIDEQLKIVSLIDSLHTNPETSIAKIKDFREQLVLTSENAYKISSELEDYKGNTGFRNAAKNYFGYIKEAYKDNPKMDTLIYMTNSEERLEIMSQTDFDYFEKEYSKYIELENDLIQEQLKFAQEFNILLNR